MKQKLKRGLLALMGIFTFTAIHAQDVALDAYEYKGGYNVSCHGLADGKIDATPTGGRSPYTFSWSNGATTEDINGLAAGTYTLTVTDHDGNHVTKSITLYEPDALDVTFDPSDYSGYNVTAYGAANGTIDVNVEGGAPPYNYAWSTGSTKAYAKSLTAGGYSVTVTDQNGCAVSGSTTLSQPDRLQISYTLSQHNDYNVSCAGGADGSIDLTVTGGAGPYNYTWSSGDFEQDLNNVAAGPYALNMFDNNGVELDTTIVLTEPPRYSVTLSTTTFANGHNTACFGCSDGTAEIASNTNGAHPYSYTWSNGLTGSSITNITAGTYSVTATDAHGCSATNSIVLTDPAPNSWSKTGNSVDSTEYIGTTNPEPIVFKTNGSEKMRITDDGKIGIGITHPTEKLDVMGNIRATGSITFAGDKQISFTPAGAGHPNIYSIGAPPILTSIPSCFPSYITSFQVPGFIQLVSDPGGDPAASSHDLAMGWDGANGVIDLASADPASALYLNQYCGKNIAMCFGTNGGDIAACSTGKFGIGTNAPASKLDVVNGFAHFTYNTQTAPASDPFGGLTIGYNRSNGGAEVNLYNVFENPDPVGTPTTAFIFSQKIASAGYNDLLTIMSNGKIGIGTNTPNFKVDVYGDQFSGMHVTTAAAATYGIKVNVQGSSTKAFVIENSGVEQWRIDAAGVSYGHEVYLQLDPFPDYVFAKEYNLNRLEDVEAFINKNHHLPNIPSAEEVKKNGIGTGELETKLLQKVEELTLYIIEQNKRIEQLEKLKGINEK